MDQRSCTWRRYACLSRDWRPKRSKGARWKRRIHKWKRQTASWTNTAKKFSKKTRTYRFSLRSGPASWRHLVTLFALTLCLCNRWGYYSPRSTSWNCSCLRGLRTIITSKEKTATKIGPWRPMGCITNAWSSTHRWPPSSRSWRVTSGTWRGKWQPTSDRLWTTTRPSNLNRKAVQSSGSSRRSCSTCSRTTPTVLTPSRMSLTI